MFETIKPSGEKGKRKPNRITLGEELSSGNNAEGTVWQASLEYKDRERVVDGLVFKEFHYGNPEEIMRILNLWERMFKFNQRLKAENERPISLPGVVRGLTFPQKRGWFSRIINPEKLRPGLIMTDLSKGGEREVFDLKLINNFAQDLTQDQWNKIKSQVIYETKTLLDENIDLQAYGAFRILTQLDPWLVIRDINTREVSLCIADVGSFSIFDPEPMSPEHKKEKLTIAREALDFLECNIFS